MVRSPSEHWIAPVAGRWNAMGDGEALALALPAYRPDMLETLAKRLGARFVDFRRQRLMPLGWNAAALPLHALDDAAVEEMRGGVPVVLHNCEALLSLVTAAARRAWFAEALERIWPARLLLPVVLFTGDLPDEAGGRIVALAAEDLPAETLLDRLSGFS